jgi:hypothetical protein
MDMGLEFGLMPRATATGTNVQVCSSKSLIGEHKVQKEEKRREERKLTIRWQTFTGALGGATADPVCAPFLLLLPPLPILVPDCPTLSCQYFDSVKGREERKGRTRG